MAALASTTTINSNTRDLIERMSNSSSNDAAVLAAFNLTKQVSSPEGSLTILDDVSFSVAPGESIAIVGASGAGKSTLLSLLAGLDVPSRGHVVLDGKDLGKLDEDGRARVRADSVGFVFQSFHLVPSLNALENVMLPLELAGVDNAADASRSIIEKVGLAERWSHYPAQLSGGEKQRVALARALARRRAVQAHRQPRQPHGREDHAAHVRPEQEFFDDARARYPRRRACCTVRPGTEPRRG